MWGVCDKPEIWKGVKPPNERLTVNVLHDVGIQVVIDKIRYLLAWVPVLSNDW
jgi:hypothetical protein